MERGLYGQAESDAGIVNAAAESRGNIEAEGHRTTDGNLTEQGYRAALAKAAAGDFLARRGEDTAVKSALPEVIRGITIRGWQDDQRANLQAQADLVESMRVDGFAWGNRMAALTCAPGMAGGAARELREANSKAFQGAPDRTGFSIKKAVRRKPAMYAIETHALVNADGSKKI